jgi:hypothetical protein
MSKETPAWLPEAHEFCRSAGIEVSGWGSDTLLVKVESPDRANRVASQLRPLGFEPIEDEDEAGLLLLSRNPAATRAKQTESWTHVDVSRRPTIERAAPVLEGSLSIWCFWYSIAKAEPKSSDYLLAGCQSFLGLEAPDVPRRTAGPPQFSMERDSLDANSGGRDGSCRGPEPRSRYIDARIERQATSWDLWLSLCPRFARPPEERDQPAATRTEIGDQVSLMCSVMNRVHKTQQWTVARGAQEFALSGQVKSGQWWSGQNRPTDVARDVVLLS